MESATILTPRTPPPPPPTHTHTHDPVTPVKAAFCFRLETWPNIREGPENENNISTLLLAY